MKRSIKLTLIVLLLAVTVFVAVSCGKKNVDEILINDDGMPQLVYVLGEDLDLSNGLLQVKDGEETREIPMNSEGVSTSGYDKNKLGEQTVTVVYGGKSTQITVTVVERMTIANAVTDYLIGEELDITKGNAKITRNDGTSFTVNLNNPKMSFEGFDSSSAGTVSVTVKYNAGSEVYSSSFSVEVHTVDSIVLTKAPTKGSYNSHESNDIDLTGGTITIRGNGGTIEKVIPLSSCTASGLDVSAVTEANSPCTQKITVTYVGQSVTYDVSVVYTDISKFKDKAAAFTDIDWSGSELPTIPADLGELSLELMRSYLELTKAQTNFISSAQKLAVARAAFLYGMDRIDDDLIALEDAFYMNLGQVTLVCKSYEKVEEALRILEDKDGDIYTVTPILSGIIEQFAQDDFGGATFDSYAFISVEEYGLLSGMLQYALDLYNQFEAIPEDWKTQGIENFAAQIEDVYGFMYRSGYFDAAYAQIYYAISDWRQGDDIFDLLYTHYYNTENMDVVIELASVALPTVLDELLSYILKGVEKMYSFVTYYDAYDTTEFLTYYYMAVRISEQIAASDDEMVKALYSKLPLNTLLGFTDEDDAIYYFDTIIEYLEIGEGGVQYCAISMFGTPDYHNLLDKYMDIVIKLYEDKNYVNTNEYGIAVEDLFATYLALSPAQQYNFLSSLNPMFYGMYPELAFDAFIQEGEDYTCQFVKIIHEYYRSKFSDSAAAEAYNNLVVAIEIYAQRSTYEDWISEFNTRYNKVKEIYNVMSPEDQAVFDQYFRSLFNKYEALLIRHSSNNNVNLGEWQDEFDELSATLANVGEGYQLMSEGLPTYSAFFSAFERATLLANYIRANAPKEILDVYYHDDLASITYADSNGFSTSIECSYDFAMQYYRAAFVSCLVTFTYGEQSINIYTLYNELNMAEFMNKCYEIVWSYFHQSGYDKVTALAVMEAFRQLDIEQKILFIMMEGEGFYYTALNEFAKTAFTEKAANVATKLFELEQNYIFYMYYPATDSLGYVQESLTALEAAYAELQGLDKISFEDLEDLYAYYVELCQSLITEA